MNKMIVGIFSQYTLQKREHAHLSQAIGMQYNPMILMIKTVLFVFTL